MDKATYDEILERIYESPELLPEGPISYHQLHDELLCWSRITNDESKLIDLMEAERVYGDDIAVRIYYARLGLDSAAEYDIDAELKEMIGSC